MNRETKEWKARMNHGKNVPPTHKFQIDCHVVMFDYACIDQMNHNQ